MYIHFLFVRFIDRNLVRDAVKEYVTFCVRHLAFGVHAFHIQRFEHFYRHCPFIGFSAFLALSLPFSSAHFCRLLNFLRFVFPNQRVRTISHKTITIFELNRFKDTSSVCHRNHEANDIVAKETAKKDKGKKEEKRAATR